MVLRDVPGWGVYFYTFEYLKSVFDIKTGDFLSNQGTNWFKLFMYMTSGGIAGSTSWIVSYPYDIIKAQI